MSVTLFENGLQISDDDFGILEHWLGDVTAIEQWVIGALAGKVHKRKSALIKEAREALKNEPGRTTIPIDDNEVIAEYLASPVYPGNRQQRDAAEVIALIGK